VIHKTLLWLATPLLAATSASMESGLGPCRPWLPTSETQGQPGRVGALDRVWQVRLFLFIFCLFVLLSPE
jgi:hypothetical protein